MTFDIRAVAFKEIEPLRELYRHEMNCQIVHDSATWRGLADCHLILHNGRVAGYGAVWNQYFEGRLVEFHALPHVRDRAREMCGQLLAHTRATALEAQTNCPSMLMMLYDFASDIQAENLLFEDHHVTHLEPVGVHFRKRNPDETDLDGDWVIDRDGSPVASGGFLCHYNPPYADIYMSVAEDHRRRGYGSYLVQELKRVCYEAGKQPSARCNPENQASRSTLEKAGMRVCGRLLAGPVKGS